MGTATLEVYSSVQADTLHQPADKRQIEQLPCRHRPAGRGNVLSAGKADG